MGYSFSIRPPTRCPHCHETLELGELSEDIGSYTSNVSGMWRKALGFEIRGFDGKPCRECIPHLERAVRNINDPMYCDIFRTMELENDGFGTYKGAADMLQRLLKACQEHPDSILKMWF